MKETNQLTVNLDKFKMYSGDIHGCGSGRCPRVLINDAGDVIIQGQCLSQKSVSELNVPDGESVVFLPKEIVEKLKIKLV